MSLFEKLKERADFKFNPEALAEKYKQERDKRVRADGDTQYRQATMSKYSEFVLDDPYTDLQPRDAIDQEMQVLIVGGGWTGLSTAAECRTNGVDDFVIVESGADFGGTWYWNRYPGAQCDMQSYVYLPLLEETGYIPKTNYSYAPEIFEHAQRIGRHFSLYEKAIFQTFVTDMHWDEETSRWRVTTNRGDVLRPQHIAIAIGGIHEVRLPGVAGIEDFKGRSFHTSRWDYSYTGGSPTDGALTGLADKRVGIIGTGATAIQCIPPLAESAKELYVFQRTPSTVSPRNTKPTDPEWVKTLEPGWQKRLIDDFETVFNGGEAKSSIVRNEDMLFVTENLRKVMSMIDPADFSPDILPEAMQIADYVSLEKIRQRVDEEVANPEVAEKLKPWYNLFCKRPTFSNLYLQTFDRDNVHLIDVSASRGIDRVTEKGIVANGVEYELDCIVFASGYETTTIDYKKRFGFPIDGVGGQSLYDHWGEGMRSMHALMFNGFPNLYLLGGLFPFQTGLNYSTIIQDQAHHVAHIITAVDKHQATTVQPTREGEDEWIAAQLAPPTTPRVVFIGGAPESCTPGYYNHEGKPMSERPDARREGFDKGSLAYLELLAKWRDDGQFTGMEFGR